MMFTDLPECHEGVKRTMKELSIYFDVPYNDVHKALSEVRKSGVHNELFNTETVRKLLLVHYRMASARARTRLNELQKKIQRVENAEEPVDVVCCETCRYGLGGGYDNCRINLESECAEGRHEAWEPKEDAQ